MRSEEGGIFGPVTTVVDNVLASSPALTLSKNTIYVGWDEWGFNSTPPYDTGGRLMIAASPAGSPRLNFGNPREIARTSIGFGRRIAAMPEKGAGPNLSLAVDGDKENVIYALFVDQGNGLDIRLARSRNQRFCDAASSNARVAPIGVPHDQTIKIRILVRVFSILSARILLGVRMLA